MQRKKKIEKNEELDFESCSMNKCSNFQIDKKQQKISRDIAT